MENEECRLVGDMLFRCRLVYSLVGLGELGLDKT